MSLETGFSMSMQLSHLSRLRIAGLQDSHSVRPDWWAPLRLWVGRWLVRAARADRSTSAEGSKIDDHWLDTLPASRTADALGVDGAPAMVFTDSMPRYSAWLDQPQSTMIDSPAGEPASSTRRHGLATRGAVV